MSYSCSDFVDDVLARAVELGWIDERAIESDNPAAQARLLINAMRRKTVEPLVTAAPIEAAIFHLQIARDALKVAKAPRTLARVRAALKSADGARRHARLAPIREARQ